MVLTFPWQDKPTSPASVISPSPQPSRARCWAGSQARRCRTTRSRRGTEAITFPMGMFVFVVTSEVCCSEATTILIFLLKKKPNPNLIGNNRSSDFSILVFHFTSDQVGKSGPLVVAETWKAGVGLRSSLSTASHARPPNPTEDLGLHPPQALIQRCLRPKTSGRHRAMSTLPRTRNHGAAIPASPTEPPPAWSPESRHHRSPRDKLVSPDTPFQPRTGLAVLSTPLLRCSQAAP